MILGSLTASLGTALFLLASSEALAQGTRRYIAPRTPADTAATPFSGAVLAGNTLYLSGKIGLTPDRNVPASAVEEARLVLDDVKATLTAAGMTMDDLVSVQVFCSDVRTTTPLTGSTAPTSPKSFRPGHSSAPAPCSSEPGSRSRRSP